MGRCDGYWGDVRRLLRGETVVRKHGSPKAGVTSTRKMCQFMERCDDHGSTGACGGVSVIS